MSSRAGIALPDSGGLSARIPRGERHGRLQTPGQRAAARVFGMNLLLGGLAVGSVAVVLVQLVETWHVGSSHSGHAITLLGAHVGYPAANAAAIAVASLAVLGLFTVAAATRAAVRELRADRQVRRALERRRITRLGDAWIVDDDRLHAFCAGLLRPELYVSSGAVECLSAGELDAVLAHERHHARRRDPLQLATARVVGEALLFLPASRRLAARQHALAEIGADEAAVASGGAERARLAAAMLKFADDGAGRSVGVAPERIDHLLGEAVTWRLPAALCLISVLGIVAAGALAFAVGKGASGSATLAPPLLASRPCVLVLASIAATVIGIAAAARRRGGPAQRRPVPASVDRA